MPIVVNRFVAATVSAWMRTLRNETSSFGAVVLEADVAGRARLARRVRVRVHDRAVERDRVRVVLVADLVVVPLARRAWRRARSRGRCCRSSRSSGPRRRRRRPRGSGSRGPGRSRRCGSVPGFGKRTKTPELSVASAVFHCIRRTKLSYFLVLNHSRPRPPRLTRRQPSAPSLTTSKPPGPAWVVPARSRPFQRRSKPVSGVPLAVHAATGDGLHADVVELGRDRVGGAAAQRHRAEVPGAAGR